MSSVPTSSASLDSTPPDSMMAALLDTIDELAARRPVAARLVAVTHDDTVSARGLAAVLMTDVVLTTRVMRLANSAYFGLGTRVRTVTFAVTVVGFSTIRSMAAIALAGSDDDHALPDDFWTRSKAGAFACGIVAGSFGLPTQDAFCLGLLTTLGQAILIRHDREGYQALMGHPDVAGQGRLALLTAERQSYGFGHTEISAAALSAWSFPHDLAQTLHRLDAIGAESTPWTRCLRTGLELAARLTAPDDRRDDIAALSGGAIDEERLTDLLSRLTDALGESAW